MSFAEIKKSINSDLNTPLNALITNAANNPKVIKSIQRGRVMAEYRTSGYISGGLYTTMSSSYTPLSYTHYVDITISEVNMNKCFVNITFAQSGDYRYDTGSRSGIGELINSTTLRVYVSSSNTATGNISNRIWNAFTWEVIEFY